VSLALELDFAVEAARRAGVFIMEHYLTALAVESKADTSPVTVADRGAERLIRDLIESAFPADGVLGEEHGERKGTSGRRWILDPIDGTQSFIRGVPLFGVMIGLEDRGHAVVGVVHFPALDETVWAGIGEGAFWRPPHRRSGEPPRAARVSPVAKLGEGLVSVTAAGGFDQIGKPGAYERLRKAARLDRAWGDCYGHVLVATGRAEAMVDPMMNVWDCAALLPILSEAGGTFTDWNGVATIHGGNAVSTNGHVLDEVLEALKS
jgi:histidinol-phosphatase